MLERETSEGGRNGCEQKKINMTIDIFSLRKLVEYPSKNVLGNLRNREVEFRQEGYLEPSSEDGKGDYGVGQLRLEKD